MTLLAITDWAALLGFLGLGMAALVYGYVRKQPAGTPGMIELSDQIHDGAMAFLRREYTVLLVFVVVVFGLLFWAIGLETAVAYVGGAACSVSAGFFGMKRGNARERAHRRGRHGRKRREGAPRRLLRRRGDGPRRRRARA